MSDAEGPRKLTRNSRTNASTNTRGMHLEKLPLLTRRCFRGEMLQVFRMVYENAIVGISGQPAQIHARAESDLQHGAALPHS